MSEVILAGRDLYALLNTLKAQVAERRMPIKAHHMFCSDPDCQNHLLAVGTIVIKCTCGASVVEPPVPN